MNSLPSYAHPMQQSVAIFHRAFGHPDQISSPRALPTERIELRVSMIHEEGVVELREALIDFVGGRAQTPVAIIDALIDTIYVALGGLVEMGHQVLMLPPKTIIDTHREPIETIAKRERLIIMQQLELLKKALHVSDIDRSVALFSTIAEAAYVTLTVAGIDPQPFFDEVQRSNMSKLGADGKPIYSRGIELDGYPEGKILKGPNYSVPDLAAVYQRELKRAEGSR